MRLTRDRIAAPFALAAFACLLLVVGARHEPWFDEAQAWLIAREGSPWFVVSQGVRFEGTPALWHLTLWAVQRLGLPYGGLWLVSSTLACGGAAIVLYKAPFPMLLRIGLIFSYFFAYQYSVVARSYALDLLFIPLLAWLFRFRLERPLLYLGVLGLVANTNAHSFMLAGVLALEFLWAARSRLLALDWTLAVPIALYGGLALAAMIQAWPPSDINFIIRKPGDNPLLHAVVLFTEALVDRGDVWSTAAPNDLWRIAGGVLTALILIPAALLWRKAGRLILAVGLFGGLVGFSALKYGNYWHAGIIFLTFVFCLWISWSSVERLEIRFRRWLTAALAVLVIFQIWCAAAASVRDALTPYSAAPAAARAMLARRAARDPAAPVETLGVAGFKGFAIQPYFAGNVFTSYEHGAAKPAYYLWRRSESPIPGLSEAQWRAVLAGRYDRMLLSTFHVMGFNGPARYIADARAAGYCPTEFYPGALIWKTYELESDDLMIFDRCKPQFKRPATAPGRARNAGHTP
jgi:hypothetical protein